MRWHIELNSVTFADRVDKHKTKERARNLMT